MNRFMLIYFVMLAGLALGQKKPYITPTYCPVGPPAKDFTVVKGDTLFSFSTVNLKPEFPGGSRAFYKSFAAEFKIPAEKPDLKGKIFVSFIVEKDGSLSNLKILRDLGMGTGAEALRAIRKMPKWNPAQYHTKIVRCGVALPITVPYVPLPSEQSKMREIPDKY